MQPRSKQHPTWPKRRTWWGMLDCQLLEAAWSKSKFHPSSPRHSTAPTRRKKTSSLTSPTILKGPVTTTSSAPTAKRWSVVCFSRGTSIMTVLWGLFNVSSAWNSSLTRWCSTMPNHAWISRGRVLNAVLQYLPERLTIIWLLIRSVNTIATSRRNLSLSHIPSISKTQKTKRKKKQSCLRLTEKSWLRNYQSFSLRVAA